MLEEVSVVCDGHRLKDQARSVLINGDHIGEFTKRSVSKGLEFLKKAELTEKEMNIARLILNELENRLGFLINVGLDYLTLDRMAGTLSGGEAQRIRLATQIGSALTGVLYVLDEPSIGLHQRDNNRLIDTLKKMRDLGNTLVVVEHDEETMLSADHIIDIGPRAGEHGGEIVATGTPKQIIKRSDSLTGKYLSGEKFIQIPAERRQPDGRFIEVIGAAQNNLKEIDVKIPVGLFTTVTGVSGSGKSSLVNEVLHKKLASTLNRARKRAGKHKEIKGTQHQEKVIDIDQSPIGRTPGSNPATTQVFLMISEIFMHRQMKQR